MAQPEIQEFKPYILNQLKRNRNTDDIVLHVCEKTGASWQSVHEYVNIVNEENKDDIILGKSPVLVGLAFVPFLMGVGIIIITAHNFYDIYTRNPQDLSYFFDGKTIKEAIVGILMIIGSLKGMQEVWETIFKKMGIF